MVLESEALEGPERDAVALLLHPHLAAPVAPPPDILDVVDSLYLVSPQKEASARPRGYQLGARPGRIAGNAGVQECERIFL